MELPTRRSNPTRHAVTAAAETEMSDEKEHPKSRADGKHGETELHDETHPNTRCSGDPNTSGDLPTISSGGAGK